MNKKQGVCAGRILPC